MTVRRVANPPNPYLRGHVEWLEEPPPAELEVYEETAREILAHNDSPDLSFSWSVNPYRGCTHGCAYCYARPTHQYLGYGAGTDFERRIVVKTNAPELLRQAFSRPRWQGERIVFSGVTDCYQPLEAHYELTRRCLEVCAEFKNPVGVITKGVLVERDAALLARLTSEADATVYVSVPFADDALARAVEPWVAPPSRRLQALAALGAAGVRTGVALAPMIPGLADDQIPAILARARAAGASEAFLVPLRLPAEVADVFLPRLRAALPQRARKVENAIRAMRGGKLDESGFGRRFEGLGERFRVLQRTFELHCRRLGFCDEARPERRTFRRPHEQGRLFGDGLS
jgi:DNA repair photolyase